MWDQSQMSIAVSEVQLFAISVVQTCDSLPSYAHTIHHKAVLSAILGKTGCSSATKGKNRTRHTKHASSRLFEHSPPQQKKGKKRAGLRQLIEKVAVRRCLKTRYRNGLCKKNLEFPVMGFRTSREGKKIHTWLPAHCVLFLQGLGYWEKRNAASKSFQISLTERHS